MRRRARLPLLDYGVYLLVRLIVGFAQALSIEQSYAFARLLAAILYLVDKRHRQVGLDNLKLAFGARYGAATARPSNDERIDHTGIGTRRSPDSSSAYSYGRRNRSCDPARKVRSPTSRTATPSAKMPT